MFRVFNFGGDFNMSWWLHINFRSISYDNLSLRSFIIQVFSANKYMLAPLSRYQSCLFNSAKINTALNPPFFGPQGIWIVQSFFAFVTDKVLSNLFFDAEVLPSRFQFLNFCRFCWFTEGTVTAAACFLHV